MKQRNLNGVELVEPIANAMVEQIILDGLLKLRLVMCVPNCFGGSTVDPFGAVFFDNLLAAANEKGVHLRTQSNELDDRLPVRFVFELANHLVVGRVEERTRFLIRREVEVHFLCIQLLVDVFRFDVVHQGICISEEQLRLRVLRHEVVVVESTQQKKIE